VKRLLIVLSFLFIGIGLSAQSFFKPVPKDLFTIETADRTIKGTSVWLPRPAINLTAIQWNYDKVTKSFNATAFTSIGLGVGYQHFIDTPNGPFNNFGFNAMMLLGENISGALTFSGLGILNLGVTYNLTIKQFGLLTGVQLKF
jgi:hypothetical protein